MPFFVGTSTKSAQMQALGTVFQSEELHFMGRSGECRSL
jgi:hypothetical protein